MFLFLFTSCKESNEQLLDKAFILVKNKNYTEAIKVYDNIIKSNNKIQLAYYNRGYCYLVLKNYPKALNDFNKTMALQTINGAVVTYNGNSPFSKEEDRTQASFLDALYQRAQVKFYMDSVSSSFKDFQALVDNNYKDKGNCILWQGTLLIKIGKKDQACKYFNKAKQLGDEEADLMINTYCGK